MRMWNGFTGIPGSGITENEQFPKTDILAPGVRPAVSAGSEDYNCGRDLQVRKGV